MQSEGDIVGMLLEDYGLIGDMQSAAGRPQLQRRLVCLLPSAGGRVLSSRMRLPSLLCRSQSYSGVVRAEPHAHNTIEPRRPTARRARGEIAYVREMQESGTGASPPTLRETSVRRRSLVPQSPSG